MEMHDHGMEEQRQCNCVLPKIAKDLGVGLVAANDVHFLRRSDHDAHDVMLCIGTGKMVQDENRMRYKPELYFKSAEEMREIFRDFPEAIANTLKIAEGCNLEIELGKSKYPEYPVPEGISREAYLRDLCAKGLLERYGDRAKSDPQLLQRLDYELGVLEKTGFVSYILIVWDFIHFAKERKIPVGPGRGSAAGSIVAYVLGITDIDPLQYGLIFERFLNPDRISPPDIDVDFCEARRGEVLEYVRQKYGERRVAQIITFGKLKAKSVVRDVGRVMGLSYRDADRIAKMIPNELNITLDAAAEKNGELKRAIATEPQTKELFEYGKILEGLSRNAGVHAAGVVIADRALSTRADGSHWRLHQAQKRPDEDQVRTPAAPRNLRRNLRRHDLPGAGHGRGEQTCRLLTRARRSSPARHGQKGQGKDGEGETKFHRGLCAHQQNPGKKSKCDLRFTRKIRRLRI